MIRRLLAATTALMAALAAPAVPAYAESPAVYRGVALSTSNATIAPGRCSTTTRVAVYYTDPEQQGPPPGSGIVVTEASTGAAVSVAGAAVSRRNGITGVTYALRLCGLGAAHPQNEAGWYRVAVRTGATAQPEPRAGFTVRYQGAVYLNASPEPVRRGGYVTLRASVTDGWEYSDAHPIRFFFRRSGATAWRYFGSGQPRCDTPPCDVGMVSYTATRRFRQTVSGTWKAVSQRTAVLESGSRTDAVAVA